MRLSVCLHSRGGVEGTIRIASSLGHGQLGQATAEGHRWPGCNWDAAGMPSHHLLRPWGRARGPGTLGWDAGSTADLCCHAGRCNRPSTVGCKAACSRQASRQCAQPSRSHIPGLPGSAVSTLREGWRAPRGGCAGKRRARKRSASRPWVPQPSPVGASHGGQELPGRRWRQITPFPCQLLPISVAATGRRDCTLSVPCRGAVKKGSWPPSPHSQPQGSLFLHELFSFRLDAVPRSGKGRTGAPRASFPCHKTTKRGAKRRAGPGRQVAGSGHTPLRGSSMCSVPLAAPGPASPSCAATVLPFLRAGSVTLRARAACPCAGGSWCGGHNPSLGMMPPQMGATRHPKAFALVSVPLLCCHSPKRTLKRLNPVAQLLSLEARAGRRCLHIPGTDVHPSRAARAHGAPATCALDTTTAWGPRPVPLVGCGTRDGSSPPALWLASAGLCTGHHEVPPAPAVHPAPCHSPPPGWGQCWQLARHRRGVRAACRQRAGTWQGHHPGTAGRRGAGGTHPSSGLRAGGWERRVFPFKRQALELLPLSPARALNTVHLPAACPHACLQPARN